MGFTGLAVVEPGPPRLTPKTTAILPGTRFYGIDNNLNNICNRVNYALFFS